MKEITLDAYGKLNLTLDILGRRPDGYHDLRMVMQSVSLCDRVTIRETENGQIALRTSASYLPCDRGNLAYRAAEAFFAAGDVANPGVALYVEKRIPVCAGMAGGSADAAAVLRGLRRMYAPQLSVEELCRIGERVGSDVPYCVFGGTALAEGRGEILTRLAPIPECWAVLCKPDFPVSTPELFGCVDAKKLTSHPDTPGMCESLERGDLNGVLRRVYNVFEAVLPEKYSEVFVIKDKLLDLGALSTCMTGSGPTVFGLFDNAAGAAQTAERLRREYPQTFCAAMVNLGEQFL